MTKRWAEHFSEGRTELITEGSTEVRSVWRLEVEPGTTVRLTRKRADPSRPQAVVVDSDTDLRVGEIAAKRLVLWSHNSPEDVEIECRRGGQVRVWNAWSDAGGTVQAWVGSAGMVLVPEGDSVTIGFSDGAEPADITKFIIELSVV